MAGLLGFVHSSSGLKSMPHTSSEVELLMCPVAWDAARVIGGFPLSDSNYPYCVTLLKERFGQQYKLIDAHMEALLNVSTLSNNLTSLQAFYDTVHNHISILSALNKPPDFFGPILTTVILRLADTTTTKDV